MAIYINYEAILKNLSHKSTSHFCKVGAFRRQEWCGFTSGVSILFFFYPWVIKLRRAAPSYEQQPESHNGCDNTQDQEPDGPVTRGTGEEFRQARAQRGRGLHPKDDEHHTDNEQGNPNDALHTSVLLRSASIICKDACRLLRIIPEPVPSFLFGRHLSVPRPLSCCAERSHSCNSQAFQKKGGEGFSR